MKKTQIIQILKELFFFFFYPCLIKHEAWKLATKQQKHSYYFVVIITPIISALIIFSILYYLVLMKITQYINWVNFLVLLFLFGSIPFFYQLFLRKKLHKKLIL